MPLLIIFFALILYIYCELSLLVSMSAELGIFPTLFLLIINRYFCARHLDGETTWPIHNAFNPPRLSSRQTPS